MKLVNAALAEKNLKLEQLPENIQSEVSGLESMISKYNNACDLYDEDGEEDKEIEKTLDESEELILAKDASIAQSIKSIGEPTPAEAAEPVVKEEGGSGLAWLLVGGFFAVITLGAVNIMKKK